MKNSKSIRKLLFINKTNIALIVFETINDEHNVLFAKQVNINKSLLNVKINELLTSAANFLDWNIKDVEIIFDDSDVVCGSYKNAIIPDCYNEADITKEMYKIARIKNEFINVINYTDIEYDEINKNAKVSCNYIASDYVKTLSYVAAARQCNLIVSDITNLYCLINNKDASSQIIVNMAKDETVVAEYVLGKLNKVTNFNCEVEKIYSDLSKEFDVSYDNVKKLVNICNNIEATDESSVLLTLTFDLSFRKFCGFEAGDFVKSYQAKVNKKINQSFNLLNYSDACIITNKPINMLNNAKIINYDSIIGLEGIDADKIVAFVKTKPAEVVNSQYKFENNLNLRIQTLAA